MNRADYARQRPDMETKHRYSVREPLPDQRVAYQRHLTSTTSPRAARSHNSSGIKLRHLTIILPLLSLVLLSLSGISSLPLILTAITSAISFVLYGRDKGLAVDQRWRIPETTLHMSDLCGGWMGGLCAQLYFRHKTGKRSFQMRFWAIVGVHYLLLWILVWHPVMLGLGVL